MTMLLAFLLAVSGCSLFDSEQPEDTAKAFIEALSGGNTQRAAALTDSPKAAKEALDQARNALEPERITGSVSEASEAGDGSSATAKLALTWELPERREWTYQAEAELVPGDEGWRLRWSPSMLHPELAAQQTVALQVEEPDLAPVLDREGSPLLEPKNVVSIMLYPAEAKADGGVDQVATALSNSLRRFDAGITAKSIEAGARKAKGKNGSSLVAVLRETDYLSVKSAIYDLPGVKFRKQERLLAPSKDFGVQILAGIRSLVEKRVAGEAGWRIIARDASGGEIAELHAEPAKPSEAVDTTLRRTTQAAAEDALAGVSKPAAIVALQPSSGDILAVAQNAKADTQGAIALTGRYPPGSTFKIATALAGLSSGKVRPGSKVDCPGTKVFKGRLVPNDDRFELGKVSLSRAFARSCNTTFAQLAVDLPADALTKSARDLGIGADFEIPGITTITGSAPAAEGVVQRAENGFGQGKILSSPFGLALAAATVKAGKTPTPSVLAGEETKASDLGEPLPGKHAKALRQMMRKVVTEGTATRLADLPGVHGKTGTAQFGDGKKSHGWFAGFQDDLAFAVLIVEGDSSKPAVEAAHRFLAGTS